MILKTIKEKSLHSIIKKKLSGHFIEEGFKGSEIASALCLVNYNEISDVNQLNELRDALNIDFAEFKIIAYVQKIDKNIKYPFAVFSDKSILINGAINNFKVSHYLRKEYDVVINCDSENLLPLLLVSALAKTKFRVGLGLESSDYNDLTLKGPISDFEYFKKELVKYLTILNKK